MSVVVWDGKTLAADMQSSCGELRVTTSKLSANADCSVILAWTGDDDKGRALAHWYWNGAKKEEFPECQKDKERWTRLIVADASGCRHYEQEPFPIIVHDAYAAWGSGRDFAYGAMTMGADARTAVEVACKHSTGCGMGVEAYDLKGEYK